jgi:8-oxo-dGTP diphosphatase
LILRVGEPVQFGRRYKPRPGAYVILMRNSRVLLTHQSEPFPEFQLPGGGIDPGEHAVPALHREVLEETGWTMARPRRLGAFRRFTYMPEYDLWAEKICHVYLSRPAVRQGPPKEPGHTAVWMHPNEALHSLANDGDRIFLAGVL